MAAKYWYVANNGNSSWSTAGAWYFEPGGTGGVAGVPTVNDDAYLDVSSGSGILTLTSTSTCRSLLASDFTGTLAGTSPLNIVITGTPNGNPILWLGGTWNYTGTITISGNAVGCYVVGKVGNNTYIIHRGALTINTGTIANAISFQDWESTGLTTLTSGGISNMPGTLGQLGYSIIFGSLSLSNSNTRKFQITELYLSGSGTVLSVTTQTNLQWAVDYIYLTNTTATAKTVTLSNLVGCTELWLKGSGESVTTITVNSATISKPIVFVDKLGGTIVTGTSTMSGLEFIEGTTTGWSTGSTLTMLGTIRLCNSMSVIATAGLSWASDGDFYTFNKILTTGTLSVLISATLQVYGNYISNLLTTTSMTLSTGGNVYFNGDVFVTGNVNVSNNCYLFSYGSFTAARIALTVSAEMYVSGNITVNTISHAGSNFTVQILGVTINIGTSFTVSNGGRNTELQNATINLNGIGTIWSPGSDDTNSLGASVATFNINNKSSSTVTFAGGGVGNTYGDININRGVLNRYPTITAFTGNNTFRNFRDFTTLTGDISFVHSIQFASSSATLVIDTFQVGNTGNQTNILSSSGTTRFFLYKSPGGLVICPRVFVQLSEASPINTWYAISDSGANLSTGWIFTNPSRRLSSLGVG